VTDMYGLFFDAYLFNANLSRWDVSRVTDSGAMFSGAASFKGDGRPEWNTSQIVAMASMFELATSLDVNYLSKWDTSKVVDFSYMFYGIDTMYQTDAFKIGGPSNITGLDEWNTSLVENMAHMFDWWASFDADLSRWNTSRVRDLSWMFHQATSFHGIGVDHWDISKVETMDGMFSHAKGYDGNLQRWDVSHVTDMSFMFAYASSFVGTGLQDKMQLPICLSQQLHFRQTCSHGIFQMLKTQQECLIMQYHLMVAGDAWKKICAYVLAMTKTRKVIAYRAHCKQAESLNLNLTPTLISKQSGANRSNFLQILVLLMSFLSH
jgi:Mycoplasma protein of unknown function, DUF285